MHTLKNLLIALFDGKNSKSYSKLLTSNKELLNQVQQFQTTHSISTIAEALWLIIHSRSSQELCACGKPKLFNTFNLGYRKYCSVSCNSRKQDHSNAIKAVWTDTEKLNAMLEKKKETNIAKYGHSNPMSNTTVQDKVKSTNLSKYGVEFPLESSAVQDKIKETLLERYNVDCTFKSKEIQQKASTTFWKNHKSASDKMEIARAAFIQQYGTNPFAVPAIKDKIKQTMKDRFGVQHFNMLHLPANIIDILENKSKFIEEVSGLTISEAAEKLTVDPSTIAKRAFTYGCKDVFAKSSRSSLEYKLKNFLIQHGLKENDDFICSDRSVLNGKELDFYFPKIRAAVEVGSVFWHSEISAGRKVAYHYDKWKNCQAAGIDLYQYWDFELKNSWDVVASKILYLFKQHTTVVGARKLSVKPVSLDDERKFLNKNHIQGSTNDRSITVGAYYNNALVGIMLLANRPHGIEIVRYASNTTASYPGLFSKLLKHALMFVEQSSIDIFSFSDNRHSAGNVYSKSGFTAVKHSEPMYHYTKDYHSLESKKKYNKQKIATKFNVDITDKTEWQLMQELGYDRIWDAGKILWKLTVSKSK